MSSGWTIDRTVECGRPGMFAKFNLGHSWSSQHGGEARESSAAHFYGFREDVDADKIRPYLHLVSIYDWSTRPETISRTMLYFKDRFRSYCRSAASNVFSHPFPEGDPAEWHSTPKLIVREVSKLLTNPFTENVKFFFSAKANIDAVTGSPDMVKDLISNERFQEEWVSLVMEIGRKHRRWIGEEITKEKRLRKEEFGLLKRSSHR